MRIRYVGSTNPAPMVPALGTSHMIAASNLLYSHMTLRAIREVTRQEPVAHLFLKHLLTVLTFMSGPCHQTLPAEFELTMLAYVICSLLLVALSHLIASRIRTIRLIRIDHHFQVLFEL